MNINNSINPTSIGFNILNSTPPLSYSYSRNPTSAELYEEYLRNELLKMSKIQRSKPVTMGSYVSMGAKLPGVSNIINNIPDLSKSITRLVGGVSAISSILSDSSRYVESLRTRSQAKDLGTIGKIYRGLNLFSTLTTPLSLAAYLGTAVTGHVVPNLKYSALSGLTGLIGAPFGLGAMGAGLAPFLFSIGSMIVSTMKNKARMSLRSNKSKLIKEVSQYSRSAFVMKDVNRMLMSGQITSGDALIASLLSLIEENTSVMPAMYVSTEHKHQVKELDTHETLTAYKKELTPEEDEEKHHKTFSYLLDTIEEAALKAKAKYDPFFQLSNFLTRGKTPSAVMEELETVLGTEKEKKNIERVSELTSKEIGLHIADTKLMITPSDLIIEKGETYESKSIILAAAQFDLLRVIARESSAIRKYGFGIPNDKISGKVSELSLLQANVEMYKEKMSETPLDKLFKMTFGGHGLFEKIPVVSSLYSIASKLSELLQPKQLFQKLKERFAEFGVNLVKKIAGKYNVEDRTSAIKEILSSLGVVKSVVERRDEFLADELPNVLHEQLVTQKDIYDVLSDIYKSITGNKHQSKNDEERELKWDAITRKYLSPEEIRKQLGTIISTVSSQLRNQYEELTKEREGLGIIDRFREAIANWGSKRGYLHTFKSIANTTKGLPGEVLELLQNPNKSKTTVQELHEKLRGQEFYLGDHEEYEALLNEIYKEGIPRKQLKAKIEEEKTPTTSMMSSFCDCISHISDALREKPLQVEVVSISDELCRKCFLPPPSGPSLLPPSSGPLVLPPSPSGPSLLSPSFDLSSFLKSLDLSYHKEAECLSSIFKSTECFPVKICNVDSLASSILEGDTNEPDLKKKEVESYEVTIEYLPEIHDILSKIVKYEEDQSENKKFSFLSDIKHFLSDLFSRFKGLRELFDKGIKNTVLDIIKNDINTVKRIVLGSVESVISKIKGVRDAGLGIFKSVSDKIKAAKDAGLGVIESVSDKIKAAKDAGVGMFKSTVDKIKAAKDAGVGMFKSTIDKIKAAKDAGLGMVKSVSDKIKGAKNAGLGSVKNVLSTIKGVGLGTAETVINAVKGVKNAGLSGVFNMIKSSIFKSNKSADDSQEDNVGKEITEISERDLRAKQVKAYDTIIEYLPYIYNILSNKPVKREGDQSDNKKDKDGGSSFLSDMFSNIGSLLLDGFLLSKFKWLRGGKSKSKILQTLFSKGNSVLKWARGLFSKGAGLGAAEGVGLGATKGAETAITAVKGAEGAAEGVGLGAAEGAAEGVGMGAAEGAASTAKSLAKFAKAAKIGGGLLTAGLGVYTAYDAYKKGGIKAAAKDVSGTVGSVGGALAGAALGQALIPIPIVGAVVGSMVGGYLGDKLGKEIGGDVISAIDDQMSAQTKKIDEIQNTVTQNDEEQDEKSRIDTNKIDIAKVFDKNDPDSPLNKFLTATEALLAASQLIIAGSKIMAKSASVPPSPIPAVVPSAPTTQQSSKGLDTMIYNLFETDNVIGLRNGLIKFGLGEQYA